MFKTVDKVIDDYKEGISVYVITRINVMIYSCTG